MQPPLLGFRSSFIKLFGLLFCVINNVSCNDCSRPSDYIQNVNETAPPGTPLFTLDTSGGVTWRHNIEDPEIRAILERYLNFDVIGDEYIVSLKKTFDLEEFYEIYNVSYPIFTIKIFCAVGDIVTHYDFFLTVVAVSEYPPVFNTTNIRVTAKETSKTDVLLLTLKDFASDRDINTMTSEIRGFEIVPSDSPGGDDDETYFKIFNYRIGQVLTKRPLDYESLPMDQKFLSVVVKVMDDSGKSATATLTVFIEDVDDLPPEFTYPDCPAPCLNIYYTVSVSANATGIVTGIKPAPLAAKDGDTLGSLVTYSIVRGPDDYPDYFSMDASTGALTITKQLKSTGLSELVLTIMAQEVSDLQLRASTTLLINVEDGGGGGGGDGGGGGGGGGAVASASMENGDIKTLAIVLGVIVIIIIIILLITIIAFRLRYKKAIHPDRNENPRNQNTAADPHTTERTDTANNTHGDRPRKLQLSDEEPMKIDEEMATWLTVNQHRDIVDLSDEDTLRWKKKNGVPPNGTHLNSRDSAFEESDRNGASEGSHRDQDSYPETEYAEVGTPTQEKDGVQEYARSEQNIYSDDPTQRTNMDAATTDSGVEENEYLTPETARLRRLAPYVAYNKAFRGDSGEDDPAKADVSRNEMQQSSAEVGSSGVKSRAEALEKQGTAGKSLTKSRKTQKKSDRRQNLPLESQSEESEIPEYSTPKSNRSSLLEHPVPTAISTPVGAAKSKESDDDEDRPAVPPRPKVRPLSGLLMQDVVDENENHYARVNKKKKSKPKDVNSNAAEIPNTAEDPKRDSSMKNDGSNIEPPARRKRPKKRQNPKQVRAPEEDVYDGTKDYEDLEMDPSFYTDTNKSKVKRSSRIPVMQPDPNDTRYWITVNNDY